MDKKEAYELGLDRGKAIATDMDLLAEVLVNIDATNRYECPACGEGYIDKGMIVGKVERQICDGHSGCSATFTTLAGLPDYIHDMHVQRAHIIESTDRQFSPFEHTAYAINYADDPNCNDSHISYCDNCEWYQDELWEQFESGINDGIEDGLTERLGLTEESNE